MWAVESDSLSSLYGLCVFLNFVMKHPSHVYSCVAARSFGKDSWMAESSSYILAAAFCAAFRFWSIAQLHCIPESRAGRQPSLVVSPCGVHAMKRE